MNAGVIAQDPAAVVAGLLVVGFLSWLARWAWTHTHARITETQKLLHEHEQEDRRRHEEVIRATTKLETQMGRFISDIDSEKRTRAEVNKEIFAKLDRINDRLPERRNEPRDGRG